jgi:ribonuclease D
VTDALRLRSAVERLRSGGRIAFDTEAASFHRYVDRIYLIQLSSDRDTVLADPLAIHDLGVLRDVLADPAVEVIFHDADYDLRILDRDYGFRARCVFDTRVAAQLAGEPAVGLGSLLEKQFGVKLDKKFQRADWSLRPLPPDMLAYAAADTQYLPALRDTLESTLRRLGRLAWAEEEFRRLEAIRWAPASADDEPYLRIKGAKALTRRQLAVLREVFAWRETTARHLDRAPFRVLSNAALLNLARHTPTSESKLAQVSGVGAKTIRRSADAILERIEAGLAVPQSEWPRVRRSRRPPPDPAYDQRLERLKHLRNVRARAIDLDPGLVCPNGTLQAIARAAPMSPGNLERIDELRRWQREVLGDEPLLEAVAGN